MNRLLAVLFLVVMLTGACAPKQALKPEEAAPSEPELKLPEIEIKKPVEEAKKPEVQPAAKKPEEQYIMLNFDNADIETVITTIGEMLKINYILAPGVSGKITIQSHNKIPISELFSTFQSILEFNGFTAVKYGSFYRIIPIDNAKQQPLQIEAGKKVIEQKDSSFVTQEIPLEYVKANDVANIVRNLMPRGTDIVVYEPQNMLIITAPPVGIMKFLKLLEAIDIPSSDRDQVKTYVYNVENGEAKKLVEILRNLYAKKGATGTTPIRTATTPAPAPTPTPGRPIPARPQPAGGATVQEGLAGEIEGDIVMEAYEDVNAILIKATPRGYVSLLETIKKLDIQARQVLIEVLIAEITLDHSMQFGIEWLLKATANVNHKDYNLIGGFTTSGNSGLLPLTTNSDGTSGRFGLPTGTTTGTTGASTTTGILSHPADVFAMVIDPTRFAGLVTAAASSSKLNVIASPHVLALDNKEAKIEVADEVPVATTITSGLAGTTTNTATSQVQFKSAGTILTVTPHINENKQVTLKLTQEVSELGQVVKIGGEDFQGFKTRKANTTAIVQDGHTLVIGGIITERKGTSRSGLPFLSDIPLLGYLFGSTTDTNERKELILMVTPHVVSNGDEADAMSKEVINRIKGVKEKVETRERQLREAKEETRKQ